ncbi:MAG: cysteine synthase A [Betaproteobacteria bacterium]|nr:cysteine synthase A [Betaproteobacteria bacterium]
MNIKAGFCGTVGNTPLIEIPSLSKLTGCRILGKAEFLNPGGSVKDRAALGIVLDAIASGRLKPGGTIIEGTAGNTGIGLTHVANALGYKTVIVIPNTQSQEKIDYLLAIGADVRPVPAVPYSNPENFNHVACRLAEELPNAVWANQFDNVANRIYHEQTTGPEIWQQTQGTIDAFVTAVGSGGTLAGVSRYLKSQRSSVHTVCVDPYGAAMYSWFKKGHLEDVVGGSITEGIGQMRVTANLENAPIDDAIRIPDAPVLEMVHYLAYHEGLFLGSSAALNVLGAVQMARKLGPGKTVVTILCDGAGRYLSRLFNEQWLNEKGLKPKARGLEFIESESSIASC